jgi:hypothetical protein
VRVFLSARAQIGSVSQLLRLNAAGTLVADVADIEISRRPSDWSIGLFEADHSLLGRPVERQVDMWGESQIGQFSTLGDCFDDFRREKRQPDEAGMRATNVKLQSHIKRV